MLGSRQESLRPWTSFMHELVTPNWHTAADSQASLSPPARGPVRPGSHLPLAEKTTMLRLPRISVPQLSLVRMSKPTAEAEHGHSNAASTTNLHVHASEAYQHATMVHEPHTGCALPQCVAAWLNAVEDPAVIEAHLVALSNDLTQGLEPQLDTLINDTTALIVCPSLPHFVTPLLCCHIVERQLECAEHARHLLLCKAVT